MTHAQPASPPCRRAGRGFRGLRTACLLAAGLVVAGAASAAQPGLAAHGAWMRFLIPSRPAAGYLVLTNDSGNDRKLTGANSPACGSIMLHQSVTENGMEVMKPVASITVPAHGRVALAPGGYHLMCMKPTAAMKVGASISLDLHFADGSTLSLDVPVRGATGQ